MTDRNIRTDVVGIDDGGGPWCGRRAIVKGPEIRILFWSLLVLWLVSAWSATTDCGCAQELCFKDSWTGITRVRLGARCWILNFHSGLDARLLRLDNDDSVKGPKPHSPGSRCASSIHSGRTMWRESESGSFLYAGRAILCLFIEVKHEHSRCKDVTTGSIPTMLC